MSEVRAPSAQVMKLLAAAIEICGTPMSPAAVRVMGDKLAAYPEAAVLKALDRCMAEVTGRLSLAAIISRIDDGRPSADEAWAQVGAASEADTVVTTDEAMRALGLVSALLAEDPVAARMAFKDAYTRIVTEARGAGIPCKVRVSLGHDRGRRQGALARAVQAGQVDAGYAASLIGVLPAELTGQSRPALPKGEARPVAELVGEVARASGPPRCGPECNGFTHTGGWSCPQWGQKDTF